MVNADLILAIKNKIAFFGFEVPSDTIIIDYLNEYSAYWNYWKLEELCFRILLHTNNNKIFRFNYDEMWDIDNNMIFSFFDSQKENLNFQVNQDFSLCNQVKLDSGFEFERKEKITVKYKSLNNSATFDYYSSGDCQFNNPDFGYVQLCFYNVFLLADFNRAKKDVVKYRTLCGDGDDILGLLSNLSQYNLIMKEYVLKDKNIKFENYSERELDAIDILLRKDIPDFRISIKNTFDLLDQMKKANLIIDYQSILSSLEIFDFDHLASNMNSILFHLKNWVTRFDNKNVINFIDCKIGKSQEQYKFEDYPLELKFYQFVIQVTNEKNNTYDFAFYSPQEDKEFILDVIVEFFSFIRSLHSYVLGGIVRMRSPEGKEYLYVENKSELLENFYPFGIETV